MADAPRPPGTLPVEVTSFVGRRAEVERVRRRLSSARLVTLLGTGGVGKSRLALRVAATTARAFPDGTWYADLGELRDPSLVVGAVLAGLDVHDHAARDPGALLRAALGDRRLLLVLDGCEHLRDEVARVLDAVLRTAPGLRVLATSRVPLDVAGEHVHPVLPLPLPGGDHGPPLDLLREQDAVRLFVDRAAAATGDFALTSANRDAVVELCRRLDGLPLAIELAAARTRTLDPVQLLERLDDRFALLTGPGPDRPRTLEATVAWSHDLLTAAEQVLLRRLAVFAGRFTVGTVEAVCHDDVLPAGAVLDTLSSLVDRSFVVRDDTATGALRLHETTRAYARDRLQEAGEAAATERRWIEHHVARRSAAAPAARFDLPGWLAGVALELDDLHAVLRVLRDAGDVGRALDLCAALCWHWVTRATAAGARRLDDLLDAPGAPDHPWACFTRGFLAVLQHDPHRATVVLGRGIAAAEAAGQPDVLAQSQAMAAIAAALTPGGSADADVLLQAARATARTADGAGHDSAGHDSAGHDSAGHDSAGHDSAGHDSTGHDAVGTALMVLQAGAMVALLADDPAAADRTAAEGVALARRTGDLYSMSMLLLDRSLAALAAGRTAEAEQLAGEALDAARRLDDRVAQWYLVAVLACCAAAREPDRAAVLLGGAEQLRTGTGGTVNPTIAPALAAARRAAERALGPSRTAARVAAGAAVPRRELVALALRLPAAAAGPVVPGPLPRRESEVALLVAEGLTNKEIGARLHIAERTVDSHVRSILSRLGMRTRSQVAAWVAARPG